MTSVAGIAALPARSAMPVIAVHLHAAAAFTTPIIATTMAVAVPVTVPKPTESGRFAAPISSALAPRLLIPAGRCPMAGNAARALNLALKSSAAGRPVLRSSPSAKEEPVPIESA